MTWHIRWTVEGIPSARGGVATAHQHKFEDDAERARAFGRRLASVGDDHFPDGDVTEVSIIPEERKEVVG